MDHKRDVLALIKIVHHRPLVLEMHRVYRLGMVSHVFAPQDLEDCYAETVCMGSKSRRWRNKLTVKPYRAVRTA